jgi:predicted ArsR family transcriptional regulator
MLNEQLGALTDVEENGSYIIRGAGCPLSALTGKHPAVCTAIETLLAEAVGATVRECCDRTERPRCCFAIQK